MIITISYDSSVNGAPSGFTTAISAAVQFLENTFTNSITINLDIGYGEINGQPLGGSALGESETYFNNYSYTQVRNALVQNAKSSDQISGANSLPSTDPTGGGNYWVATAEAKALGLMGASAAIDGYVGFSSSLPFDYDDSNGVTPGTYDFNGTFLHEITEVMGRDLFVGTDGIGSNSYTPLDLFHYSSQGVHDFSGTTAGYFSLDGGATNLDNFNTNANGDFGDWASSAGHDSFLAFSNSGVVNAFTQNDLREMNVLGYNEQSISSGPPVPSSARNDFNDDTLSDLLFQNTSNNTLMVELMNGSTVTATGTIANPTGMQVVATADFNHDYKADIVMQAASGTPQIWFMNGTSVANTVTLPNPGSFWHIVAAADFNHDGNTDILWQGNDGSPGIWFMNGTSIIGGSSLPNPGSFWHVIETGDFNGDGNADILWQGNDGTPNIWFMNGGSIIGGSSLPNPGTFWHIVGTGDFNGDDKADILWQGNDGQPGIWFMNGGSIIGGSSLPNPGAFWHVIGTGDFNGDGKSDILWQGNDGSPGVWFMNGGSIIGGVSIPNPGASWQAKDNGSAVLNASTAVVASNGVQSTQTGAGSVSPIVTAMDAPASSLIPSPQNPVQPHMVLGGSA